MNYWDVTYSYLIFTQGYEVVQSIFHVSFHEKGVGGWPEVERSGTAEI